MKIKVNAKTLAGVHTHTHTHTHTSNILKEKKSNNVNRIDKKQIELSSICVFLI